MGLQFIKHTMGRRRFIKTAAISDSAFENWLSQLAVLKKNLIEQTNLQIVGDKVFWEIDSEAQKASLMLEVIGVPLSRTQSLDYALSLQDLGEGEFLVHRLGKEGLFGLDFPTLMLQAGKIHQALTKSRSKISHLFHIVFDNDKIELHFFEQKDYIQNLL